MLNFALPERIRATLRSDPQRLRSVRKHESRLIPQPTFLFIITATAVVSVYHTVDYVKTAPFRRFLINNAKQNKVL